MRQLPLFALALFGLAACQDAPQSAVTAPARSSITTAATASTAAGQASQRSTVHIIAFRNDAARIDYKASRALRILDQP